MNRVLNRFRVVLFNSKLLNHVINARNQTRNPQKYNFSSEQKNFNQNMRACGYRVAIITLYL